jgi:hypothetical protein
MGRASAAEPRGRRLCLGRRPGRSAEVLPLRGGTVEPWVRVCSMANPTGPWRGAPSPPAWPLHGEHIRTPARHVPSIRGASPVCSGRCRPASRWWPHQASDEARRVSYPPAPFRTLVPPLHTPNFGALGVRDLAGVSCLWFGRGASCPAPFCPVRRPASEERTSRREA